MRLALPILATAGGLVLDDEDPLAPHLDITPSSDRGDFWAKPVDILVLASSTGYMFTTSGFPLLNWGICKFE